MKKLLLAMAVAAAALPALPASAAEQYAGQCRMNAVAPGLEATGGQDTFTGQLSGAFVVFTDDPAGNPVTATVRCYVTVDGSEAASTTPSTGAVLVTTAGPVTYTSTDTQVVEVCEEIAFAGNGTVTVCRPTTRTQVPPQEVIDILAQLDPTICPFIAQIPSVPGVLDINAEGDVYVAGEFVFDCPPYETA